jgi:hypothetical protein
MIKEGDKVYTFLEDGIDSVVFSYEVTYINRAHILSKLNVHYWKNYTEARAELVRRIRYQVFNLQDTCNDLMKTKKKDIKHLEFMVGNY